MLFNFRLRPLTEVALWHDADGSNPHLGWFGLTDGAYWIAAGQDELFRYSQPVIEKDIREHPNAPRIISMPYDDYYVARFWENIIEMLPALLAPIPPRLARHLAPDGPWHAWSRAVRAVTRKPPETRGPLDWDALDTAQDWWGDHYLDTFYLKFPPTIWFWNDGAHIHIGWDNRHLTEDDMPIWSATLGEYLISVEDFLEEVRAFDALFIKRMYGRIAIAQEVWKGTQVINAEQLNAEHRLRATYLQQYLRKAAEREPTDWDAVLAAIDRVATLPQFAHVPHLSE